MQSRAKLVLGLLLAVAVVVAGWVYYSPYMAVRGMQDAAQRRDAVALSDYVDFPALRESLKASLNAKLLETMAKSGDGSPGAALGTAMAQAFGGMIVNSFVDAAVSPEGLAMLMQGERPKLDKTAGVPDKPKQEVETYMGYEAYDRFVIKPKPSSGKAEEPVAMVFRRHGLATWKLSAIRLPM